MTASIDIPTTICQVYGKYWEAKVRTVSNTTMPRSGAATCPVPERMATNTNSPDVVQ